MKYTISIPEPCHEDWNKMTPNEKGRFCGSCKKTIIDFTNASKFDLAKRIHAGENICGRFKNEQLNTPLTYNNPLYRKGANWVLSLAGMLAVSAGALAQPSAVQPIASIDLMQTEILKNLEPDKDTLLLAAMVVDAGTQSPLSQVSVHVKEYPKLTTQTSENGQFKLAVLNKLEEITLVFTLSEYESKEVKVDLQKRNLSKVIQLKAEIKKVAVRLNSRVLKAIIVDKETQESIPFVAVRVVVGEELVAAAETDFDGNVEIPLKDFGNEITLKISHNSFKIVVLHLDLSKDQLPEKIELDIEEQELMTIGLVICAPVEPNNNYLREQARKYFGD